MSGEPRRPLAARAAPAFEVRTVADPLAPPDVAVVAPPPPSVDVRAAALAPPVELAPPAADALVPACVTAVPELAPPVPVVPAAHVIAVETVTAPLALAVATQAAAAALEPPRTRGRVAALAPPPVRKGSLEPVSSIRLVAGDASALGPERLRALLTKLWRASGASSPTGLQLVGVYPRVPGGAIASIAQGPEGDVVIRVLPRAKGRPALLAVARRRADGVLIPVEDAPLG